MSEKTKTILLTIGIALGAGVCFTYAFTGPSQQPPAGDTAFWRLSGNIIYRSSGNIGIGTASPSYSVHVNGGDVYASGYVRAGTQLCIGADCRSSWSAAPSGALAFFNLASCPSGWTEATSTRGRYIVGLPSSGTLAGTAGTALSNLENRPVGQHTHTVNDPGHGHSTDAGIYTTFGGNLGNNPSNAFLPTGQTSVEYTGITINATGTVAGTNAPYIQYLVCQKT